MVVRMRHTKSHTAKQAFASCNSGHELCQVRKLWGIEKKHNVCVSCGFYRGMKVIDMIKKVEKKQKKAKAKEKRKSEIIFVC